LATFYREIAIAHHGMLVGRIQTLHSRIEKSPFVQV